MRYSQCISYSIDDWHTTPVQLVQTPLEMRRCNNTPSSQRRAAIAISGHTQCRLQLTQQERTNECRIRFEFASWSSNPVTFGDRRSQCVRLLLSFSFLVLFVSFLLPPFSSSLFNHRISIALGVSVLSLLSYLPLIRRRCPAVTLTYRCTLCASAVS